MSIDVDVQRAFEKALKKVRKIKGHSGDFISLYRLPRDHGPYREGQSLTLLLDEDIPQIVLSSLTSFPRELTPESLTNAYERFGMKVSSQEALKMATQKLEEWYEIQTRH